MKRVSVNIEVHPDTRRRLKIKAAEQGVSVRELLEPIIEALTDDHRPEPGPPPPR